MVRERRLNARIIEVIAYVLGKVYSGVLVDRARRVTGGLIGDEQRGFRARRGCVGQIFTLKQMGEKPREKKRSI